MLVEEYEVRVTNNVKRNSVWVRENKTICIEAKNKIEAYSKACAFGTVLFVKQNGKIVL